MEQSGQVSMGNPSVAMGQQATGQQSQGGTLPVIDAIPNNSPAGAVAQPMPMPAPAPQQPAPTLPTPPAPPVPATPPAPVPKPAPAPATTPSESMVPKNVFSMSTNSSVTPNSEVRIESLLEECVRTKASDLHLQVGLPPILRIDGALQAIPGYGILMMPLLSD